MRLIPNRLLPMLTVWLVASAAVAEEAGEAHHGFDSSAGVWDQIAHVWGQTPFVASVVNFLLLVVVAIFLGRKPLMSFLKARRASIEDGLTEAIQMKEQAQAKYDEYQDRLARLDEELDRLRAEMIKAGQAERDRIVAEAEAKAARMRRETEFIIQQQLAQLREDVTREAVESAITTAAEVIRTKTSADDQRRLAEQYMKTLKELGQSGKGQGPRPSGVHAMRQVGQP